MKARRHFASEPPCSDKFNVPTLITGFLQENAACRSRENARGKRSVIAWLLPCESFLSLRLRRRRARSRQNTLVVDLQRIHSWITKGSPTTTNVRAPISAASQYATKVEDDLQL